MKLSICIPIYNFDVHNLVTSLHREIVKSDLDVEILLIDDASEKQYIEKNKDLESQVSQFILLNKNWGRSKIRNLFPTYSHADYLLFLDCDGKIMNDDFIKNYLDFIDKYQPEVVYGGRVVQENQPSQDYILRWKFAVERENIPLFKRLKMPYMAFQTNNFIVRKQILETFPFDENITQYGYEDLIFSEQLKKRGIKIHHIENPILNIDVEKNEIFLKKADESAKSLSQLIKADLSFSQSSDIKLVKIYSQLVKLKLTAIVTIFYKLLKPYLEKKLIKGQSSLTFLDVYKLGQLIGYMNND